MAWWEPSDLGCMGASDGRRVTRSHSRLRRWMDAGRVGKVRFYSGWIAVAVKGERANDNNKHNTSSCPVVCLAGCLPACLRLWRMDGLNERTTAPTRTHLTVLAYTLHQPPFRYNEACIHKALLLTRTHAARHAQPYRKYYCTSYSLPCQPAHIACTVISDPGRTCRLLGFRSGPRLNLPRRVRQT
jgi:hypothetical protein